MYISRKCDQKIFKNKKEKCVIVHFFDKKNFSLGELSVKLRHYRSDENK